MSRDFKLDGGSVFGDPHTGAEAAASVRFKPRPTVGPRHRKERRSWRAALVLLRERAWRK